MSIEPPSPDRVPDEINGRIDALNGQLADLFMAIWISGVREGMESSARICEVAAEAMREKPETSDADIGALATAAHLRDQIRFYSLQIEVPT